MRWCIFFNGMPFFGYWQNSSKSVALSVWNTTPQQNSKLYEEAVGWTGLVNGWYNVVTFLSAFALVWFAKKYSPKLVHFGCLVLAAIGFLTFPHIDNKYLLFPAITGLWYWLGQYDGHPLPVGGKQNTKRKLWCLHGHLST